MIRNKRIVILHEVIIDLGEKGFNDEKYFMFYKGMVKHLTI